jgi:hypothetical protein
MKSRGLNLQQTIEYYIGGFRVSNIITKELAVVDVIYKKIDLGKTSGGTTWAIEIDEKEIMKDQLGTKPADLLRTGIAHRITTSLAEGTVNRLSLIDRNFKTTGAGLSIDLSAELFTSSKEDAGTLVLRDINDNSVGGKIKFYSACAKLTGEISYGPDQQKIYGVEFYCFKDDTYDSFGYYGDPASLGLGSIDGE